NGRLCAVPSSPVPHFVKDAASLPQDAVCGVSEYPQENFTFCIEVLLRTETVKGKGQKMVLRNWKESNVE
ncbi:jg26086, partial [Pararge aegeria aegeria]